jgi:DNA-binding CsgD family transcriptional regulator/tetratricopeptide (TPR) repeat protein
LGQRTDPGANRPDRDDQSAGVERLLERESYLSEIALLVSGDSGLRVGPVIIEGHRGLGKTALLGAACQIAAEAGCSVLRARVDGLSKDVYRALVDQLSDSCAGSLAQGSGEPASDFANELEQRVRRLLGDGVVIAIDDAQWLDDRCVELLRRLRGLRGRRPRLILGVAPRSAQSPLGPVDLIMSEPGVRVMSLQPLSPGAVATLVEQYLGCFPSDAARAALYRPCYEATDGIPALVFDLLGELATGRAQTLAGSLPDPEKTTSVSVARSVLARLSRLPENATVVLEAVAVAHEPANLALIAAATKLSSVKVGALARVLEAADLVKPDAAGLQMTPLLRRSFYEEIDAKRRTRMHLAIARYLMVSGGGSEQIAEHLVAADPAHRPWVAQELIAAARHVATKGSYEQAVRYLRRAFAERPAAWDDPVLLLELVRAESHVDSQAAIEHLLRCVDTGADAKHAIGLARQLAVWQEDRDEANGDGPGTGTALRSLLDHMSVLVPNSDAHDTVELNVTRALFASPAAASSAADALRHEIDLIEPRTQAEHKAIALLAVVDSASPGRARSEDTVGAVRRVVLNAQLCSEDPFDCHVWARVLLVFARAGEFGLADQFARHAQAMSESRGLDHGLAEYSLTLAMSLQMQGSLVESSDNARRALAIAGGRWWVRRPEAVACLVANLVDQGRWEEAEALLSASTGLNGECSAFQGASLLEQRGRLRACQGRSDEALSDLLEAGRLAEEAGVDSPTVTIWRSEAALLLARQGSEQEAVRLAEANLDLARRHGADFVVGPALRVAGIVGLEAVRLDRLEESVRLLESSPALLQLATALADLGRAVRLSGRRSPEAARLILRRGLDVAYGINASPLVTRLLAEMRLSGARPRRVAVSGPESLTPGERRVVALVSAGLTNAAIARSLFLTEKTVEGHLVRAYRKLNVRSRRQLRTVFPAEESIDADPGVGTTDTAVKVQTSPAASLPSVLPASIHPFGLVAGLGDEPGDLPLEELRLRSDSAEMH